MAIVDPSVTNSPVWVWEFFNSPLVIALVTALVGVGFGGYLGNLLAHKWQLRSQRYEFQLKAYERIQLLFGRWIHAVSKKEVVELIVIRLEMMYLATLFQEDSTRTKIIDFETKLSEVEKVVQGGAGGDLGKALDEVAEFHTMVLSSVISELGFKPLKGRNG